MDRVRLQTQTMEQWIEFIQSVDLELTLSFIFNSWKKHLAEKRRYQIVISTG